MSISEMKNKLRKERSRRKVNKLRKERSRKKVLARHFAVRAFTIEQ